MGSRTNDDRKIVLEHCPNGGHRCQSSLKKMNDLLLNANDAIAAKDLRNAMKYQSEAFKETFQITHEKCVPCADLFREIIISSLETQIHDLTKLTTGFLRKKGYQSTLERAKKLHWELKTQMMDTIEKRDTTN